MQNSVKVSVVIPTYNDGEYLSETIETLKNQTFQNFETVIVNDASTDSKTLEMLSKLEKEGYKVIHLQKNSGPSVARNRGIKEACGEYILPLDADDKIAPSYIEKAKDILDRDKNIGIVYCKAEFFGNRVGKWNLPPFKFPDILVKNMIFATAMYRKNDWEKVGGYNENMHHGNEDYDFWLSLLELGVEVYQIPEILFSYRIKKNSRTVKLKREKKEIETYMQIFRNHQKLYCENMEIFFKELQKKEKEIKRRDREIKETHAKLAKAYKMNEKAGKELEYAHRVIAHKDALLDSMRIKNRVRQLLEKINPFAKAKESNILHKSEIKPPQGYSYQVPLLTKATEEEIERFKQKPLISIVMPVYNIDPKWLQKAIESIEHQWYKNWELCIADDNSSNPETIRYLKSLQNPKIKVKFLDNNLNISGATNAALELAKGDYIALMDNDDEITPDALYEMVKTINETDAEFIYSDEDFIDTKGICSNPHYKPDFSPDLLLTHNYITHFTCFKHSLLDKVGKFNSEFDGSQDYDLFLRLTEKTDKIVHIPKVLYHWRMLESSTSANAEAKPEAIERGRKVLEATLKRRNIDGWVEHGNIPHYFRVRFRIKENPLVSIIIPFKDKPELLEMCIDSILEKSTYQNYEIIGISNNSEEENTFKVMKQLEKRDQRVKFYEYNIPFNYASINNHAVNIYAKGEHILLLNNDIEVIEPEWIEAMLEHSQREEIGCVGAKLYYPNDTIQHAGIIIGLGGYAGHSHKMYPRDNPGYFNRLNAIQNVSAVTAACLMVKKSIYQEVEGMDEVNFKIAYNDVDFCLRAMKHGYRNLFTPYAELYHHESISRGYETTAEKLARFQKEKDALSIKYKELLTNGDPYYNPNLTHDREDFSLR